MIQQIGELARRGAGRVQTCDPRPGAAEVAGCVPVRDWAAAPCDFLVPYANLLAITEEVVTAFPEGVWFCVGAANSPFADAGAKEIFDGRGIMHIPESISSAGAILADSVEVHSLLLNHDRRRSSSSRSNARRTS